ncbi:MAG TPA: DUF6585 family protein [Pyrinomonadaceae bacterium]|jgi:hypothetical protein
MPQTIQNLGRLEAVYNTSPAYLQRAAMTAVISFVFFLAMLLVFSVRQNIGYFLLATAFLIVQIFTLFGWVTQSRSRLKIFENGFEYRKKTCRWDEIAAIDFKTGKRTQIGCEITKTNGEKIYLSEVIHRFEEAVERIKEKFAEKTVY